MAERFSFVSPQVLEKRIKDVMPKSTQENTNLVVNTLNADTDASDSAKQFYQQKLATAPELQCLTTVENVTFVSPIFPVNRTKDMIPKNTQKNTNWGVNTWNAWTDARNGARQVGRPKLPTAAELKFITPLELNEHLCFFVHEARTKNGKLYPSESLYNLLCGLARYLREDLQRPDLNFMSSGNIYFNKFRQSLDYQMSLATEQGIGTVKKQALSVSKTQEESLWEKGILNMDTADGLSKTVYFYNCKVFGLRGRDEHRNLEAGQYTFGTDENGRFLEFHGRVRKNVSDGFVKRKASQTHIKQYDNGKNLCVYNVFKKYLDTIGRSGYFYKKPLPTEQGDEIQFSDQRLPIRKLSSYFSDMMRKGGFRGQYTGHSGKVTLSTSMFNNGVDAERAKERTGHRSRCYKRASTSQLRQISDMMDIQAPKTMKFSKTNKLNPPEEYATEIINIDDSPDEDGDVLFQGTGNFCNEDMETVQERFNDKRKENALGYYYVHKKLRYKRHRSIHERQNIRTSSHGFLKP